MDVHPLCLLLKESTGASLQQVSDPHQREEILIEALYELSRSVLPALGPPRKTQEYQERLEEVLELISVISIALVRAARGHRGVAVLSEIGEGCLDPALKRKCSIYAHELVTKLEGETAKYRVPEVKGLRPRQLGSAVAFVLAVLYLSWSVVGTLNQPDESAPPTRPEPVPLPSAVYHATPYPPDTSTALAGASAVRERSQGETRQSERVATELKPAALPGELITRVRVVNSQILVPVTLKNAGEAVRVELVLDTGATRTAVHESLATKLRIDLRNTKISQSEVADGRMISSRVARIDSLAVGPFAISAAEVELISYKGSDGIHDGLLGMDFLARHRYQIDMERELIRWF